MVIVFDLDDTLYNEIDFVKSGFYEISQYLNDDNFYSFMLEEFTQNGSGKVFNKLIENFNLDISLKKLIEIYRFHRPTISLSNDTYKLLEYSKKFHTALISDGHYIMQKNKFQVLELEQYISYPIFTDFHHTNKPKLKAFEMIMEHFKDEKKFIYISDNPKKDFIAPNQLNWKSIRYKNPNGIYKNYINNATYEVENILDIINVIKAIHEK